MTSKHAHKMRITALFSPVTHCVYSELEKSYCKWRKNRSCEITAVVSALHFRDSRDTSMRISIVSIVGDYMLTVFSRYNSMVTCFRVCMPSRQSNSVSMSQAYP